MEICLEGISERYFIYFLEDVFLTKKVNTERIIKLLKILKDDQVSCLRLYPSPGPDYPYSRDNDLGVIKKDASYRVSTMTAIWDKKSFLRLLKPGENAWQMELEGTKRSWLINDLYLSVWPKSPAIEYFATAIKRGKWLYDVASFCHREGIAVDFTRRPTETMWRYFCRRLERTPVLGWYFKLPSRLNNFAKRVIFRDI